MPSRLPVFFVLLLLSGLLLAAAGAQGASAGPLASTFVLEEDFEGELDEAEGEEETVEAECRAAGDEADEAELGLYDDESCAEIAQVDKEKKGAGKKNGGSAPVAPQECMLRSAHTRAAVNAAGDKLKLTIGYTTYEPVTARVEVHQGSSRIVTIRRRLGRSGVLRIVKNLDDVGAPKRVMVRLAVLNSPSYCGKYETEKARVH